MIKVLETFKINSNKGVLVCELFDDSEISKKLMSNVENYKEFEVETPKRCFSEPKTRNIVLHGNYDLKNIKFVNFMH